MRNRMKTLCLFVLAITLIFSFMGCSKDESTNNSSANPNVAPLSPTGTIQGRLVDRVTLQPIVGAVVDIGVSSGATNVDGVFTIWNVPATCDAMNEYCTGDYLITIDMQNVTSPVNVNDPAAMFKYPKFAYESVEVTFSSLDDTSGNNPGGGSGTNHDTPVIGLVSTVNMSVGKLSATITGAVAGCPGPSFFQNVGPGYTVQLISNGYTDNSASGASQNVVQSTVTGTNGEFTFSKVEALGSFMICAKDANNTFYGCADGDPSTTPDYVTGEDVEPVSAPTDSQIKTLTIQSSSAVHVCSTDIHGPAVTAISPALGSDIAPGSTNVVFTFSEPVKQTALTTTGAGMPGNLLDQIEVMYAGNKADAVAHTLAWNATFDQLTVTLTTAPSGLFYIRLMDIDGMFTDAADNGAAMGMCPDDDDVPSAFGITADGGSTDCTAYFTTSGATTAAAPTSVVVLNLNTMDAKVNAPHLDWLPTVGSKSYNIYAQAFQWPGYPVPATGAMTGTGAQASAAIFVTNTNNTEWTPGIGNEIDLIEGDNIPLAATFTVFGVNADGVESATGASANISDKIAPQLNAITIPTGTVGNAVQLGFNEDMSEVAAELATNYTFSIQPGFAAPAITGVQYASRVEVLTVDSLHWSVVAGSDVCTATLAADDTRAMINNVATCAQNGTGPALVLADCGTGGALCAGAGATGGCCADANGVCRAVLTAGQLAGGNIQATPANVIPICVTEGADHILQSTPGGTNFILSAIAGIRATSGVTDVAGNAINTSDDEYSVNTVGGVTGPF
jgi:hypothetical protein